MDGSEWYLEYEIHQDRPGLLGNIASALGMLSINILSISGMGERRRGVLFSTGNKSKVALLEKIVSQVDDITVTALRPPILVDRLAIRHGRALDSCSQDRTYRFTREELGLLVDFLASMLQQGGHQLIGLRGMPRVGKTESIVAASVCANKRWVLLSSTLLRRTISTSLEVDRESGRNVYIIDGGVSAHHADERHSELLREVLCLQVSKVIEHPDMFVRNSSLTMNDFHCLIELRNHPDEIITYEALESELEMRHW
ncbi:DUF3388 domain-containing protein [Pasteuria penetrans]|uniref:DUF3388 domain-containing protein n=1 Tax=Pasteuria penetrans TaxID=86005 RepID=UPI000F9FE98B|nr:DUF3388 domain-containing protein [Pasteuria penetrans]